MNLLQEQWTVQPGQEVGFDIGNVRYTAALHKENLLRFMKQTEEKNEEKLIPLQKTDALLSIRPNLYDVPVMLKFNEKIELPSKENIAFFIGMPIFSEVVLEVKKDEYLVLDTTMNMKHPRSFHGDVTNGATCFLYHTPVYGGVEDVPAQEENAIVPIEIRNKDTEHHEITRMILRKENMGIFLHEGSLFTNRIRITLLPGEGIDVTFDSRSFMKEAKSLMEVKERKIAETLMGLLPGVIRRGTARDFGF